MSRYWPDYLRSMGLWGKPKSEWPLSIIREQIIVMMNYGLRQ